MNNSKFGRIVNRFRHNCIEKRKNRRVHMSYSRLTAMRAMTNANLCTIFTSLKYVEVDMGLSIYRSRTAPL